MVMCKIFCYTSRSKYSCILSKKLEIVGIVKINYGLLVSTCYNPFFFAVSTFSHIFQKYKFSENMYIANICKLTVYTVI